MEMVIPNQCVVRRAAFAVTRTRYIWVNKRSWLAKERVTGLLRRGVNCPEMLNAE